MNINLHNITDIKVEQHKQYRDDVEPYMVSTIMLTDKDGKQFELFAYGTDTGDMPIDFLIGDINGNE